MKAKTLPPVRLTNLADAKDGGGMVKHDGIACLYNQEIDRLFSVMELAPGLFGASLNEPNKILILNQHDSWQPIGKADKFDDGKDELRMDFLLNTDVQAGKEVDSNMRNGVLTGLSVGFDVVKIETEKRGEGPRAYEVDRIVDAVLREVSAVSFPAIDGARVENSAIDPDSAITFSIEGNPAAHQRLMAGDHIRLATFPHAIKRIRPQLAEDEKYPRLREALNRIINRV